MTEMLTPSYTFQGYTVKYKKKRKKFRKKLENWINSSGSKCVIAISSVLALV